MSETVTHTLPYYLNHFTANWGKSLKQRKKAATYYAEACTVHNFMAQFAFESLPEFKDWRKSQWWRVFYVGSGVLLPEFLDAPDAMVANLLAWHSVSLDDQQAILDDGLELATLNGNTQVIPLKNLEPAHIARAFIKADGSHRPNEEQVQWLHEHIRPNLVVLQNGGIRVTHACIILPNVLKGLLRGEDHPLSSNDLYEIADELRARGE